MLLTEKRGWMNGREIFIKLDYWWSLGYMENQDMRLTDR
jgi:hypothetical protein